MLLLFVDCVCCCFVASSVTVLCHLASCLVLLTSQLFRNSHSCLLWRPQGPLPPVPPPFARVTDTLRPCLSCAQVVVRVGFPSLCLAFFCLRAGPFWVACLGGVVPGALLRSSSPALSGMRYGLEGSSANRVGVSTPLVYSPWALSSRPCDQASFSEGWQRLLIVPAVSACFAGSLFAQYHYV